ncbi:MAG: response regulator [Planctomycetes bacterium]|nr:response regulator [Planctomycetota bacterium]
MGRPLRVLFVEDCEDDVLLAVRELRAHGFDLTWERVEAAEPLRAALRGDPWNIVLSDMQMPHLTGTEALSICREALPDLPFILLSGTVGEETAVAVVKAGANDYLLKGNLARLPVAIDRELRDAEERRERRKSEEQLLQLQKMDSIGRLAGGVAHDFNNLLSAIIGFADLLSMKLPQDSPLAKYVHEIRRAGDRAAELTRQLLTMSRKEVIAPRVLDLNAVVAGMDKLLRRVIGEDIVLTSLFEPGLGRVKADPGQMEQVIMNLAVNARDAMPDRGKLTIQTANAELDAACARRHGPVRPGPYVLLAVSDTGCGMDAETQSRIFEPFVTTKAVGKGTGLGLATVYGIVKQSGGNVWVYSEVGVGTTFKIYLPRVDEPVDCGVPAAPRVLRLQGTETVLVAEDESIVRDLTCQVLQMYGYDVLPARNGEEARGISERHPATIHLLVTDVVMPDMNGRELAERLTLLRPTMKALFLSGYPSNALVDHGVPDPGIAFLQKPFTPEGLARKLREILDAPRSPLPPGGRN